MANGFSSDSGVTNISPIAVVTRPAWISANNASTTPSVCGLLNDEHASKGEERVIEP